MVNDILPTTIIKNNPDIQYKSWLEYLEGDDLNSDFSNIVNESKKFLCKNILYNPDITKIENNYTDMSYYGHKYNIICIQEYEHKIDTDLFKKYNGIHSYFLTLSFSYFDLMNYKIFTTIKDNEYYIVPLLYKDFYKDIDISHMLEDYNSFSTIIDYTKGIVYMNDVLLNYIKQKPDQKYDIICNVLVEFDKYNRIKDLHDEPLCIEEFWTENNRKVVNAIAEDNEPVPNFSLDYLPNELTMSMFMDQDYFDVDGIYMTYANMPYRIYSTYVTGSTGELYYNKTFGYFSQDKNRTAINVLAYDVCKYGFAKPLVFKYFNGNLISQSKTRLLIAKYLKLPYIPAIIYQTSDNIDGTSRNILPHTMNKNMKIDISDDDVEFKQMLYPTLSQFQLVRL